jgi:hypothetical protein
LYDLGVGLRRQKREDVVVGLALLEIDRLAFGLLASQRGFLVASISACCYDGMPSARGHKLSTVGAAPDDWRLVVRKH